MLISFLEFLHYVSDVHDSWRLVFKASNTFNESIYDKYTGTDVVSDPTEEHLSLDSTCNNGCWYKHPLVENWSNVNIDQVLKYIYFGCHTCGEYTFQKHFSEE